MRRTTRPRYIPAPNVAVGDLIQVKLPPRDGIVRTETGTVARREYQGTDRVYYTEEGGELLRWNPSRKPPQVILIIAAPEGKQTLAGLEYPRD